VVVSEETGRTSVAAFGELVQGISPAELLERINRHFEVQRPTSMQIDEFPADIPLAQETEPHPIERTQQ
jgi:hypothetical protein